MNAAHMRDCSGILSPSVALSGMPFTMAADKHMCGSKLEPEEFLDALIGAEKLSGLAEVKSEISVSCREQKERAGILR